MPDEYLRGYDDLTPEQIVAIAAQRAIIEQVKGMLMIVYGIDAEGAFELLRIRSRAKGVKLRQLAEQLAIDLRSIARDQTDLRSVCDAVLLSVHERVSRR